MAAPETTDTIADIAMSVVKLPDSEPVGNLTDVYAEGEPESEYTAEDPETEGDWAEEEASIEPESMSEGIGYEEGMMDWETNVKVYGPWWGFHYGITIILFMALFLYSLVALIYYARRGPHSCRSYYCTLITLMSIMAGARVVQFSIDPYGSRRRLNAVVANILFNVSLPCMSAAFYLLFTAMVKLTKVKLLRPGIFSRKMIIVITLIHFVIAISLDLITGIMLQFRVYLIICQGFFICWSLCLCAMYAYLAKRMHECASKRQNTLVTVYNNNGGVTMMGKEPPSTFPENAPGKTDKSQGKRALQRGLSTVHLTRSPQLVFALKLMLVTVSLFVIMAAQQVFLVYDALSSAWFKDWAVHIGPWAWWGLALSGRLIEFSLCLTLLLAATRGMQVKISRAVKGKLWKQRDISHKFSGQNGNSSGTQSESC